MKTILHTANSRGGADHGWLKAKHTFSFANYYDPDRIHFGALRVINDDTIAPNRGFGTHPHDNMEIISLPLSGDLAHRDSMGNGSVIRYGDIQVMSAGTGIFHSEKNPNADRNTQLLQIWVLPNQQNVTPRYQQLRLADNEKFNDFQQLVSPNPNDEGAWIHQNAWFNLAKFAPGTQKTYCLHGENQGVYAFVIRGKVEISGVPLGERDGLGVWETTEIEVLAQSEAEILLMEVPMI